MSDRNILAATGEMLKMPARRKDLAEPPKSFHEETVTVVPTPSKVQGDWHEPLDLWTAEKAVGTYIGLYRFLFHTHTHTLHMHIYRET